MTRSARARNRDGDLERLRHKIPADCPLFVRLLHDTYNRVLFECVTDEGRIGLAGRFQVASAYITGFVDGWHLAHRH